jgi:hypothetical protein
VKNWTAKRHLAPHWSKFAEKGKYDLLVSMELQAVRDAEGARSHPVLAGRSGREGPSTPGGNPPLPRISRSVSRKPWERAFYRPEMAVTTISSQST